MFDRKCKDCIVLKRIKNAFVREELKNSELIIQNGKTYDDAIIINEQGKEILEFINNKRTVEEIINLMIQKYPEVEKDVVENDVYSFLYEGERREIIKVRVLMATLDGNTKTLLPVSELPCILSLIQ